MYIITLIVIILLVDDWPNKPYIRIKIIIADKTQNTPLHTFINHYIHKTAFHCYPTQLTIRRRAIYQIACVISDTVVKCSISEADLAL